MSERDGYPEETTGRAEPADETEGQADVEAAAQAEPIALSYAEYEELKTLAQERDDYLRRLQRAVADYQNLQRRIERFRMQAREDAVRSAAEEILPIADSLARALQAAERTEGAENIVEGLRLVEKEFYDALGKFNIRPVEAVGSLFDPHYHEAAMQEPAAEAAPNTVVRELKKGFVMGDLVIRPSQVVVAGPEPPPAGPEQAGAGEEGR